MAAWLAMVLCAAPPPALGQPARRASAPVTDAQGPFAALVERLSEPGGYFDTDNLISNESSYLHVLGKLAALGVAGGAYVGVGPDQNYSYLAAIRPQIAYLVDIRRDNALQHLLYKALFARSQNRIEFLCRWLGRPLPNDAREWKDAPLDRLIAYLDGPSVSDVEAARERRETRQLVESYGVPLSGAERATIERFHREFQRAGLDLRFSSHGRGNARDYPTLRDLLRERDDKGAQSSYLARESAWRVVKELHARDRIVPVVGDLAGPKAIRAIGEHARSLGLTISAFYTSNVEQYVWRDGNFTALAENVAALPSDPRSAVIRSYFNRGPRHPQAVPGYISTQTVHRLVDFVRRFRDGDFTSYWAVATLDAK